MKLPKLPKLYCTCADHETLVDTVISVSYTEHFGELQKGILNHTLL